MPFRHYKTTSSNIYFLNTHFSHCLCKCLSNTLKTLDSIGNCQRPLFPLGISQLMHKITNLWKFELNWSSKLRDNNEIKNTFVTRSCVLSVAWFWDLKVPVSNLMLKCCKLPFYLIHSHFEICQHQNILDHIILVFKNCCPFLTFDETQSRQAFNLTLIDLWANSGGSHRHSSLNYAISKLFIFLSHYILIYKIKKTVLLCVMQCTKKNLSAL